MLISVIYKRLFKLSSIIIICYFCIGSVSSLYAYEKSNGNKLVIKKSDLIANMQLQGRVLPLATLDITAPANSIVDKVYVQLGQKVTKGQKIMVLKSDQLNIDIRNAKEALIRAQLDYNKKQTWLNSDDVFQAKQSNLKSKLNYQRADEVFKQNQILFKQGIISQNELERSDINYNDAKLNLELSNRHLKQIINQGDDIQLKLLKLALDNAQAKLNIFEKIHNKLNITAPINGVILRANNKNQEAKTNNLLNILANGKAVSSNDNILAIGNLNGFAVNIQANEQIVQSIKLNQKVEIIIPALNNKNTFDGIVTAIDAQPNTTDITAPPKYNIKINADYNSKQQNIFLGMTAKIKFSLIESTDTIMVPFSSIVFDNNKAYIKNWYNDKEIYITLGKTSQDKIEVLTGLKPGDIIQKTPVSYG